ncbi:MAG TPA: TonB-dependent receptor [Steroidobacteraceae bacterium]|jgi:vitamin B12 transporter|nr:TonB-dependent receptor [Steroidobacteraceae bacterium]
MRIQWLGSIVGVLAASASGVARADSPDFADTLQPVVVTATKIPTPESQLASSVTVISAEQIAAMQATTLPDVLKYVPGLNLVQSGGPGGQTSVFMRGTNSNHVKVTVDGIDVSDPGTPNGSFDFGQFLVQDIERIEVLRGPQSGLYGSDAIGGVINVITKNGSGPPQLVAALEAGSFQTFNQAVAVSGSQDAFHYAVSLAHEHAGSTPVTPLDLLAPGEGRRNDYDDNLTVSTKLSYVANSALDWGVVGRYTDTHLHFTGDNFNLVPAVPDANQSETDTGSYYGRVFQHLALLDGRLDQTLDVAYTRNRSDNFSLDNGESLAIGQRLKFDYQGAFKIIDSQTLVFGAEHARDEISEPIDAGLSIDSGYLELQSQLAQRLFSAINVRYDSNSLFGHKVTFRIAPTYVIAETGTQLRASVGTGFKAPTLSQLFQNFPPTFFANPDLKPESSIGWDLGAEQALLAGTVRAGATYFHIRLRDLIDSNDTFTTNINVDKATTSGVESFISYRPWAALTLRLDYTYTEATDDTTQQELLRRPKNKTSLDGNWQATAALSFNTDLLYVGPWNDFPRYGFATAQAPGYFTVNVAGNYKLRSNVEVYARMNNLLDRRYEDPSGFLQPAFGVFAGIKARL